MYICKMKETLRHHTSTTKQTSYTTLNMGLFSRNSVSPIYSVLGTDMHCHLLPGVDDGSHDITETVACLRTMASVGFKKVYFTPHFQAKYPNKEDDILQRFEKLKKELANHTDLPEIAAVSGEYRFDPLFARRPGVDKVVLLPNNMLLSEFSLHDNNYMPIDIFQTYMDMHYTIILAHPERYPYLGPHSPEIKKMKDMGILFQINILSLDGFYGQVAMEKGFEYIERGYVELLGTDMHNTNYANALTHSTNSRRIKKMLKSHTFINNTL